MAERVSVEVLLDAGVPGERQDALLAVLEQWGLQPQARVVPPHRGLGIACLALLSLPVGAFLTALVGKLAEDAYTGLKQVVHSICRRGEHEPPRPLVLRDTATGVRLILEADLPEQAYRQLFELDLAQFPVGPVHYDHHTGRWRSDLAGPPARSG